MSRAHLQNPFAKQPFDVLKELVEPFPVLAVFDQQLLADLLASVSRTSLVVTGVSVALLAIPAELFLQQLLLFASSLSMLVVTALLVV